MNFTSVLLYILTGYGLYYAAMIAWDNYVAGKKLEDDIDTIDIFDATEAVEEYTNSSIDEVIAVDSPVPIAGPIYSSNQYEEPEVTIGGGMPVEQILTRLKLYGDNLDTESINWLEKMGAQWELVTLAA